MSAQEIIPPSPAGAEAGPGDLPPITPSRRQDGWTGERQRAFLEALAEGSSVVAACNLVGLSERSAYAFRRGARGAAFALGWQAARLLCRETLADALMDRAIHGTPHIHFDRDGSETHYKRHDNHLAFKMLSRADRLAGSGGGEATHAAARLVAGDFEQYLDMIERDGGPARAGLFLGSRLGAAEPANDDDLAPVRALARADRWLRTHTDLADPMATADLDPAQRASWTADQWLRAEAAGLLQLAPPEPPEPSEPPAAPAPQTPREAELREHSPEIDRVWWCDLSEDWRTDFPPPEGFDGEEQGEFGDEEYERELSPDEFDALEADRSDELAQHRATEERARDAWFGSAERPDACPQAPPRIEHDEGSVERG